MRASLHDSPAVENDDLVGFPNRRETVRDRQRRTAARKVAQPVLDEPLRLVVERRGRFIEDEDRGIPQDRAGDRDPLLLAPREPEAARTDDGVETVWEALDESVDAGDAERTPQLGVRRARSGELEVRADGVVNEVRSPGRRPRWSMNGYRLRYR